MDENRMALAEVRLSRARELLAEAKSLMENGAYKSANNRVYYSFEKSVKALLALVSKDAKTHAGVLSLFNQEYVHNADFFTHDDYVMFKTSEYIRSASDYDDFYVAKKEDCVKQVENAQHMLDKVEKYIQHIKE